MHIPQMSVNKLQNQMQLRVTLVSGVPINSVHTLHVSECHLQLQMVS